MPNVQDRDALYYPYIHIREQQINWLKATLLCFPQVRRIVPGDFHLNDPEVAAPFRKVKGARGEPLLGEEYTDMHAGGSPVSAAQQKLLTVLKENEALVQERYSRKTAEHDLGDKANAFEMHTGKMLAPLHDYLLSKELGWVRAFKNSLVPYAEELTDLVDPAKRAKQLLAKAQEVTAAWDAHRKSLPGFAQDALVSAAEVSMPALALGAVAAASPIAIAAGAGFIIYYATYKGHKIWRDYRKNIGGPLNFLTKIEKAGASLVLPPVASVSDAHVFKVPS